MKWIQKKPKKQIRRHDDPITQIAKVRGIPLDDINRFLRPTSNETHDPYLFKNINKASDRIVQAIENNERIVISMDCDVDGITSGVIMYRYLKNYSDSVDYIYGERDYGHGISSQIELESLLSYVNIDTLFEELKPTGRGKNRVIPEPKSKRQLRFEHNYTNVEKLVNADLLIIVDSSSNDEHGLKKLKEELDIDIIILDHHEVEDGFNANDYAILVNAMQPDCEYPNKNLSGAGVVYKTIKVVEDNFGNVNVDDYMDLVAVGMQGDMMKVDNYENRYLIMNGLRNVKNAGVTRILKSGKEDLFRLNSDAIGFKIAPLINGVSRMGNIHLAIEMLLEDDDKVCQSIQRKMKKLNEERKKTQLELFTEYRNHININQKVLMVISEKSSRGFNGVIAQNISDEYKRPAIVARSHKDSISGSCRSYNGFDMKSFVSELDFVEANGHPEAFGITFPSDKLDEFNEYIQNNLPDLTDVEKTIEYDIEIDVDDISEYLKPVEQFNLLTGNGFDKVKVKVTGILVDEVNIIGKTMETCKISTLDGYELMKFKVKEDYGSELGCYDEIECVGELKLNIFYNFVKKEKISTPQILMDDYRVV